MKVFIQSTGGFTREYEQWKQRKLSTFRKVKQKGQRKEKDTTVCVSSKAFPDKALVCTHSKSQSAHFDQIFF